MDIIIIPAYEPDESLLRLADDFLKQGCSNLIIVDDGSGDRFSDIFDALRDKGLTVLSYPENKGKGYAMKTAMRYISENYDGDYYCVTVDSDGQHTPKDAFRLLETAKAHPNAFSLGVRKFNEKIPFRSKIGNNATKLVFRVCSGIWVSDTQTGLRAFSDRLLPEMLAVEGERYEYEMNQLMHCAAEKIAVNEIPIETIYHDMQNSCSHFDTFRDAKRIAKVLFSADNSAIKFVGSSVVSFAADYILFFPMTWLAGIAFDESTALVTGNIAARIVSASLNYYLNSTLVFRHKEQRLKSALQYAALAITILALNTAVLFFFSEIIMLPKALAKIITELILFILSYTVQKCIIFRKKRSVRKS